MKRILLFAVMALCTATGFSQEEEEKKNDDRKGKFRKENIFIGGGINVGAGNRGFAIGILPEVGYSITSWLDAGISFNLNYETQKIEDFTGAVYAKYRSFNYGVGTFVRIWPVNFLHIAAQPEYNWIKLTMTDVISNQKQTATYKAESLLVGIGYGNREVGSRLSYLTVMIDVADNINSPYRDQYNRARPIFRTGFGFYLGRR